MLAKHVMHHAGALDLESGPLYLRPWRPTDADALVAAVQESMESVGRWLAWCQPGYGPSEAASWISHCEQGLRTGDHLAFAVLDQRDGQLLGGMGLNQFNSVHRCANMGYWIRQSHQRLGHCTRAATRLARFGFGELGLIRIEIVTLPGNLSSRRTAKKIGARFETVARHRLWHDGRPRDGAVYSLIPGDLLQARSPQSMPPS